MTAFKARERNKLRRGRIELIIMQTLLENGNSDSSERQATVDQQGRS